MLSWLKGTVNPKIKQCFSITCYYYLFVLVCVALPSVSDVSCISLQVRRLKHQKKNITPKQSRWIKKHFRKESIWKWFWGSIKVFNCRKIQNFIGNLCTQYVSFFSMILFIVFYMNTRWWRRKLKLKVVFSILWKLSLPVFVRLLYLCLICLLKKCLSSHYKKCTGTHTTSVQPSSQPGHHILPSPFYFSFFLPPVPHLFAIPPLFAWLASTQYIHNVTPYLVFKVPPPIHTQDTLYAFSKGQASVS